MEDVEKEKTIKLEHYSENGKSVNIIKLQNINDEREVHEWFCTDEIEKQLGHFDKIKVISDGLQSFFDGKIYKVISCQTLTHSITK